MEFPTLYRYNTMYIGSHSIVLLAKNHLCCYFTMCIYCNRFIIVEFGDAGRQSDAGVY